MTHHLSRTVHMLIVVILVVLVVIIVVFGTLALIPFLAGLALGTRL